MKKLIKLSLGLFMVFTLFGCGSQTSDAKKTLEEKGYTIQRQEQFKDVQRSVNLKSSDGKIVVVGHFKLDKSLMGIGYGEDGKYYYAPELVKLGFESDDSLKSNYEQWLKDMDIDEKGLIQYLTDINNETREPVDLQSNVEKANLEAELKKPSQDRYDDDFYLESTSMKVFMDAFMKDGKVVTFAFADETFGADKLFVYTNDKVFKDEGVAGYMLFLYNLNITHEEFMAYLENVYKHNF